MSEELYKKHRPTAFKGVIGQEEACKTLLSMTKGKKVPHALLFTGPSGCGKTTLARIVRGKIECGDSDFYEVNTANFRGIDTVREIDQRMRLAPVSGKTRVWLIDEAHKLTNDAQNAILKMLEDTPRHVYFMLCTTEPNKLIKAIITRCTEVRCQPVPQDKLEDLIRDVLEKEGKEMGPECLSRICEVADGSPRKALVLLGQVIDIDSDEDRIKIILSSDVKVQAIAIAKALIGKKPWAEVKGLVKACEEDPESIRRLILGYASAVLLNSGMPRAAIILDRFRDHWYDCGKPGLVLACWEVCQTK